VNKIVTKEHEDNLSRKRKFLEDKAALKDVALRYKEFKSEDEALDALKAKSPSTYEKVIKLHTYVKEKIDKLAPEAKEFVTEVTSAARKLHRDHLAGVPINLEEVKTQAVKFIEKYRALPESAKESFKTEFPILSGVVKNEKFQTIAQQYVKVN